MPEDNAAEPIDRIGELENQVAQLFGLMRHHGWGVDAYLAAQNEEATVAQEQNLQE